MSKTKVIIAAFIASLALSAVAAATASAAQWYVAGAKLSGSANLATEAKTDVGATLNAPGLKIVVTCTGNLLGKLPKITAENKGSAEALTFMGCTETSPANCSVASEIPTNPVEAEVSLGTAKEDRVLFKPVAPSKTFATVTFKGTSCSVEGEKPVTGSVKLKAPTGQEENTLQLLEGLGSLEQSPDLLQVAGNQAYIEGGKALLKLESGSKWSFH